MTAPRVSQEDVNAAARILLDNMYEHDKLRKAIALALATVRAEERAICEAEIEALKARLGVVE